MTKFLAIKLIEPQTVPVLAEEKGKSRRWPLLAALAVITVVLTVAAWNYLPKLIPQLGLRRIVRTERTPRMPQTTDRKPATSTRPSAKEPVQPRPTTPRQPSPAPTPTVATSAAIPWFGLLSPIIEGIKSNAGSIYSVTSGAEGTLLISGVSPGNVEAASIAPLPRSRAVGSEVLLSSKPVAGGIRYIVSVKLIPNTAIDPTAQSVPPYLRGAVLRELDSLARAAGLNEVSSGAVGRDVIEGGSRYLISLRGNGSLDNIANFIRRVEGFGKMIEVSRFSLEGTGGNPLGEDVVKAGFIFRVYTLPANNPQPVASRGSEDLAQ